MNPGWCILLMLVRLSLVKPTTPNSQPGSDDILDLPSLPALIDPNPGPRTGCFERDRGFEPVLPDDCQSVIENLIRDPDFLKNVSWGTAGTESLQPTYRVPWGWQCDTCLMYIRSVFQQPVLDHFRLLDVATTGRSIVTYCSAGRKYFVGGAKRVGGKGFFITLQHPSSPPEKTVDWGTKRCRSGPLESLTAFPDAPTPLVAAPGAPAVDSNAQSNPAEIPATDRTPRRDLSEATPAQPSFNTQDTENHNNEVFPNLQTAPQEVPPQFPQETLPKPSALNTTSPLPHPPPPISCFIPTTGTNQPLSATECYAAIRLFLQERDSLIPRNWEFSRSPPKGVYSVPDARMSGKCGMLVDSMTQGTQDSFSLAQAAWYASEVVRQCVEEGEKLGGRVGVGKEEAEGFYVGIVGSD